jgi:hypothetical protein
LRALLHQGKIGGSDRVKAFIRKRFARDIISLGRIFGFILKECLILKEKSQFGGFYDERLSRVYEEHKKPN